MDLSSSSFHYYKMRCTEMQLKVYNTNDSQLVYQDIVNKQNALIIIKSIHTGRPFSKWFLVRENC